MRLIIAIAALSLGLSLSAAEPARAAEPAANFYKDRQMRIIAPSSPGGLFDLFCRLLAEHMPKHIPGKPTMIVQNMGGSGGLVAANHMANVAPKDGSVIAAGYSSTPTASLFQPADAKFNSANLAWIGSITKDPYVAYVWHTSPIRSIEDLKTREAIFGGNALGSASVDNAVYAREMFGLKLKIISGYAASVDVKLAMERGEIDGTFGNGWSSLKTGEPTWLPERKVFLLAQFGLEKHPDLPDVPLFLDFAKNQADRQTLELVLGRSDISRPYFAPPGTPADRLEILRRAFDATMKDPEFLAAAEKAKAPVDGPMTGEQVAAIVNRLAATPPEIVDRIVKMLADFQSGKTR